MTALCYCTVHRPIVCNTTADCDDDDDDDEATSNSGTMQQVAAADPLVKCRPRLIWL